MAFTTIEERAAKAAEAKKKRVLPRRDIQGLRAFAVVAVVLDHLLQWPSGGFIGVDVFFVISGFLITGLLVREHEKTGHISFVAFYRRRVKRIIPAAALVLAATVVVSYATLTASRAASVRTDSIWAFLFSANWRFRSIGTDYFTADAAISPLQHFWSLSIEEQFYFVWPWLMLAILTALMYRDASFVAASRVVFATIAVISTASFIWALNETGSNPNGAYFSTFSRTWELGLGAICAVAAPMFWRIPDAIRPVLAWAGLTVMTLSLFVVSSDSGFPAPWAALPVLATAVVIAAGTHEDRQYQQPHFWPVTNLATNYVGDVSYSLYLWHFPVIILGEVIIGDSTVDKLILAAVMIGASVFSFHLVEDPIRRSTIWEMTRYRRQKTGAHYFPHAVRKTYRYYGLACAVFVAAITGALALRPVETPKTFDVTVAATGDDRGDGAGRDQEAASPGAVVAPKGTPGFKLQEDIAAALGQDAWPSSVRGALDAAIGAPEAPQDVLSCSNPGPVDQSCVWGPPDAGRVAVVVGDSIAMTYVNPLRQALNPEGWKVYGFQSYGCLFIQDEITSDDPAVSAKCAERKRTAIDAIADIKPDVVFVANTYDQVTMSGASSPIDQRSLVADQLAPELDAISGATKEIVLLSAPPAGAEIGDCFTTNSVPADCVTQISSNWLNRAAAEQAFTADSGYAWIDASQWFCVQQLCPAFVGSTPTKVDRTHMTPAYGELIVEPLRAALQQVLKGRPKGKV